MLTDEDLLFMKQTRDEVTAKRKFPVIVTYTTGEENPWTGEIEGGGPVDRVLQAVVTEVSSQTTAGAERYLTLGIQYEKGDIWLSIDLEEIEDIADIIERIAYDGKDHVILAMDKKGIGVRNRYEILARVAS